MFADDGGSVFEGAIQTAFIRPEPDTPLRFILKSIRVQYIEVFLQKNRKKNNRLQWIQSKYQLLYFAIATPLNLSSAPTLPSSLLARSKGERKGGRGEEEALGQPPI